MVFLSKLKLVFLVVLVTLQMTSFLFRYWDYLSFYSIIDFFCSCFQCFHIFFLFRCWSTKSFDNWNFLFMLQVLHSLPDARRSALLFSFNAVTAFVCPFITSIRFPFMTENTTIVVSSDPLIMMSSSEVIVRQRTAPRCSLENKKKTI